MDYKYIEQLAERYFEGETTLQEEQILRTFFTQEEEEIPVELRKYAPVFATLVHEFGLSLGDDFYDRVLKLTEEAPTVVKARTIRLSERLRPLLRAAAVVAVVLSLTQAMNLSLSQGQQQNDEINYADYKDTYDDPVAARGQVEDALQLLSEGYSQAHQGDTLMSVFPTEEQ